MTTLAQLREEIAELKELEKKAQSCSYFGDKLREAIPEQLPRLLEIMEKALDVVGASERRLEVWTKETYVNLDKALKTFHATLEELERDK